MRKLKVRAWDKVNKEMTLNDSFYELQKWNRTEKELNDFELVQYTGLKDRTGRDIYEGNLLNVNVPTNSGCDDWRIKEVVYSKRFCRFEFRGKLIEIEIDMLRFYGNRSEIIGNIYENPELLEMVE
jgi:uncharacterized phage protein (TIGR01671 family)